MENNDLKKHVITPQAYKTIKLVEKLLKAVESDLHKIQSKDFETMAEEKKKKLCYRVLQLTYSLESSLDHEKGGQIAKNLQELYKHVRFAVVRVRDENDFAFLPSASKVIAEINEGWGMVSGASTSAA